MRSWVAKASRSLSVCIQGKKAALSLLCPKASRDSPHPRADRKQQRGNPNSKRIWGPWAQPERQPQVEALQQWRNEWPSNQGSERTLESPSGRHSEGSPSCSHRIAEGPLLRPEASQNDACSPPVFSFPSCAAQERSPCTELKSLSWRHPARHPRSSPGVPGLGLLLLLSPFPPNRGR